MALDLIEKMKWDDPAGKKIRKGEFEVQELFVLLALNQDLALTNPRIPSHISMGIQEKIHGILSC